MILRVRTNLGTTKITIENDQTATIQELLKIIIDKLNISNLTQNLVLTYDLAGERPIPVRSGQQSLSEVGLKHGDEVFIKGKFEEVIVEKSYVNEQHELVKAGKSLRLIEELQSDEKEGDELRLEKPVATNSTDLKDDSKSALPARSEVKPTADSSLKSSAISSSPQVNLPSSTNAPLIPTAPPTNHPPPRAPIPAYYDANGSPMKTGGDRREMYGVEGDEDGVRAPDEVQKMRLIDFPSPSRDFTPAETERLNQYRQQLREAGLKEYDIETMLQEMKDEMLAERLRRQMSMEDRLSYQQYTTLDQLEQLLANHRRPPPFTTNTRSSATSIYRPDYQRNTANPIRATNAAAVGGGHKRKLIDEFKLNNDDAVPLLQAKTTKQTKQTTSTTTKPPNRLQGAGERIVRNSFDSDENHTTGATAANSRKKPQNTFNTPHLSTATAEDHRQIIDLVGDDGNDTGKGPSEPPSSLLRSGYQPLSSYRGQKSNDPWTSTSNSHSISRQTTSSSSTARRGETASHSKKDEAVEVDEDAAFEEMMRRAIEESKRESEMKAAKINPKAETKPSASSLLPTPSSSISSAAMRQRGELSSHTTTLRAKSATSNTNNSTNNARSGAATISSTAKIRDGAIDRKVPPVKLERQSSAKAASSGSNKVKEDELEEMMRLQQQLDEEAARELQESEDLAFAKYHERDGSEDFNALGLGGDRESLRNALHYNDPLPAAMNQRMNAGLTSDLIELMRMRTAGITSELREDRLFPLPSTHGEDFFGSTRNIDTARVVSEGRGGSGGVGSGGYYDEEDELLARALQNSLNEK